MNHYKLNKGFDLNLAGKAEKQLKEIKPKKVALQPVEFRGIKAKLDVSEGDKVKKGTPLFHAKSNNDIKFVSPVSGKVTEINYGERRALLEVVVETDEKNDAVKTDIPNNPNRDQIIEAMLAGGMWPFIKQRPFSKIANPEDIPRDIFVSAMDTSPLAPDIGYILKDQQESFQSGIDILTKLTEGKIYLSVNAGKNKSDSYFDKIKNVELNSFEGPHPAGNVGVHIHHIKPLKAGQLIWVVQPVAVALIGQFFKTGVFPEERIIALAGNAINNQGYYKTIVGTPVSSLVNENNLTYPEPRYISGSVLTGRKILTKGYVGFYDSLLTIIPEGSSKKKLLEWFVPGANKLSYSRTFLSSWLPQKEYEVDTRINGGDRAFVMTGDYEKVLPMDIYPVQLVKSILVEDITDMEGLGILELDEEDVALCSYICPSKHDFGGIIRHGLDLIEKEG